MKSKDYTVIIVIAIVSAVVSILLSSTVIPTGDKNVQVEVVEPITDVFERPPTRYFNANAVNPTQEIRIQQDDNSNPFGSN